MIATTMDIYREAEVCSLSLVVSFLQYDFFPHFGLQCWDITLHTPPFLAGIWKYSVQ